ncbi:unnamed protein product [Brugia pahangi]|uniref:Uncharacterized protein n=1 Tax=Brugia pahangi TaxID=6280 RepID=A0A0N4SYX0_BRUPA|nr:unnamed protein product [Brugia pahangi]
MYISPCPFSLQASAEYDSELKLHALRGGSRCERGNTLHMYNLRNEFSDNKEQENDTQLMCSTDNEDR